MGKKDICELTRDETVWLERLVDNATEQHLKSYASIIAMAKDDKKAKKLLDKLGEEPYQAYDKLRTMSAKLQAMRNR